MEGNLTTTVKLEGHLAGHTTPEADPYHGCYSPDSGIRLEDWLAGNRSPS